MKTCPRCKETKPLDAFHKNRAHWDGVASYCISCHAPYMKECRAKNPAAYARIHRKRDLKKNYGITIERYEELFAAQLGTCAICSKTSDHRKLDVDHDHETGAVRGLLCGNCNRGIFREDPTLLRNAATYFEWGGLAA